MFRLVAALLLTTSPLAAQEFYGSARLSLGQSQTSHQSLCKGPMARSCQVAQT